jgi:chromosomal replication initiation ATPase DnaA
MTAPPDQLTLDLAHRPALGAEDFLVSASNQAACDVIDRWPDWPSRSVLVVAPSGAGKTHLANVWRLKSGASAFPAAALSEQDVTRADGALLVEDLHGGIGNERVLFHLLNLVREHKLSMLLTSWLAPGEMEVSLPDLRSRLRALPVVAIEPPDEALLKSVLVKHFADRQLTVEPHVISYVALHMKQSMEAAATIVAEIDRRALASHRKVTRALAAEVLAPGQGSSG